MELCDNDCIAICDFCTKLSVTKHEDIFGICQAYGKIVERSDGTNCEQFRCFNLNTESNQ